MPKILKCCSPRCIFWKCQELGCCQEPLSLRPLEPTSRSVPACGALCARQFARDGLILWKTHETSIDAVHIDTPLIDIICFKNIIHYIYNACIYILYECIFPFFIGLKYTRVIGEAYTTFVVEELRMFYASFVERRLRALDVLSYHCHRRLVNSQLKRRKTQISKTRKITYWGCMYVVQQFKVYKKF